MTTPRKSPSSRTTTGTRSERPAPRAKDLQPRATGANRGSPAASVMKQFAKTKSESGGNKS
jgi:hypothetical protein